jgi:hypothetical protein
MRYSDTIVNIVLLIELFSHVGIYELLLAAIIVVFDTSTFVVILEASSGQT